MNDLLLATLLTGIGAGSAFFLARISISTGYVGVDQGVHAACAGVGAYFTGIYAASTMR